MSYEELVETATAALAGIRHLLCGHEIATCEEIVEADNHGCGIHEEDFGAFECAMSRLKNQFPCEIAAHAP